MQEASKEGARRHDRGAGPEDATVHHGYGSEPLPRDLDLRRLPLEKGEPGGGEDHPAHPFRVRLLVGLRTRRLDRRPAAAIEQPELDPGLVDRPRHLSTERVDFADQVPLGEAADGRVAGHAGDRSTVEGHERGRAAEARRGQGGLASGVARTYDDDVEATLRRAHFPMQKCLKILS